MYRIINSGLIILFCLTALSGEKAMAQITQLQAEEKAREQVETQNLDSLLNDLFFEEEDPEFLFSKKKNFHFLYFRTNYGSKTFYAGREIGIDQYNLFGQLYYFHSSGFYGGISGAWYSQLNPEYRTTILTAGLSKGRGKVFGYRTSFNSFFFNNDDPAYEPIYDYSVNAGVTLRNSWLGSRLDGSVLFGKETGTQLLWSTYVRIPLIRLNRIDKIRLEPQFSMYFGTETIEYGTASEELPDVVEYTTVDYQGMLNRQLEVPVTISLGRFDLEISWIRNMPRSMDKDISYPSTSCFEIGFGYLLSL